MSCEFTNDELKELLTIIREQYGYDFTEYAEASLRRRLDRFCQIANVTKFDLKYNVTNDKTFFLWLKRSITVNVTEMFRDPDFFATLRREVFPALATYPHLKVWHAGCATGEEAFSMAIMLHEAGLLERTRIYATDMNMNNIEKGASGIVPLSNMKEYTTNYLQAGGKEDFASYYTAGYDQAIMRKDIRDKILFSQHNLVTDHVFNEFQLICCRNVLIYFKRSLQNRVINLMHQSLSTIGYLALGTKETMAGASCADKFEIVSKPNKIYRLTT